MTSRTTPPAAPLTQQQILEATLARIGPEAFTAEDYNPGLIRHIVMFQFAPTATAQQRAQVVERFIALQNACRRRNGARYILDIQAGAQSSGEGADKGFNVAIVVTLKSEGDRNYYVGTPVVVDPHFYDPAHQAYKDFVKPLVSAGFVFDFAVEHHTYLKATTA